MEKINRILNNPDYKSFLDKNKAEEKERIFCLHHFDHLLSVARLTYILILEDGNPFISREIAYAAGLLHDIGRWQQYKDSTDHAHSSAKLAETILAGAGFSDDQKELIVKAIAQHRLKEDYNEHRSPLGLALRRADSLSRLCFNCQASKQCKKYEQQPTKDFLQY